MSAKSGKSNNFPSNAQTFPLTRKFLAKLKLKAVRRGVWFKELKREERKLLDLTMRVVQRVQSFLLAKLVSKMVERLFVALESMVFRLMRTKGQDLAKKLARVGKAWGNKVAKFWANDQGFIQFLTVTNLLSFTTNAPV